MRITTNDRELGPVDALVWDASGTQVAGPFAKLEDAIAWIKANRHRLK